jgi:polyhydroxyalkanoate synthesis regulator phasin
MANPSRAAKRPAKSKSRGGRKRSRRSSQQNSQGVGHNVAVVRDAVVKTVLAPVNAVLLTRRQIQDVAEDAVRRGRMTRDDAQQMIQTLLQHGARQTDDFLADLERLLGRGKDFETQQGKRDGRKKDSRKKDARKGTRPSSNLPISGYDDLSAAAVQERLADLTPAELRRLRDYERRHANRKTVLDPIERKLR